MFELPVNQLMNIFLLLVAVVMVLFDKKSRAQSTKSSIALVVLGIVLLAMSVGLNAINSSSHSIVAVLSLQEDGFIALCGYLCIVVALKEIWRGRTKQR
jgi:uncharacterized membrane protein